MREPTTMQRTQAAFLVEEYLSGREDVAVNEIMARVGKDGSILLFAMWERLEALGHTWADTIEGLLKRVTEASLKTYEAGQLPWQAASR